MYFFVVGLIDIQEKIKQLPFSYTFFKRYTNTFVLEKNVT